jgi:ubiquitin
MLGFAVDLNLIDNSKETVINNAAKLINKAKIVGLTLNEKKKPR